MRHYREKLLRELIAKEIELADDRLSVGAITEAFSHLERAHVLGQGITFEHTRVHWRMLKIGWQAKHWREIFGQLIRIVGAATKTPFGIYPSGNTGGSDVWFFKRMPIPDDLQKMLK